MHRRIDRWRARARDDDAQPERVAVRLGVECEVDLLPHAVRRRVVRVGALEALQAADQSAADDRVGKGPIGDFQVVARADPCLCDALSLRRTSSRSST